VNRRKPAITAARRPKPDDDKVLLVFEDFRKTKPGTAKNHHVAQSTLPVRVARPVNAHSETPITVRGLVDEPKIHTPKLAPVPAAREAAAEPATHEALEVVPAKTAPAAQPPDKWIDDLLAANERAYEHKSTAAEPHPLSDDDDYLAAGLSPTEDDEFNTEPSDVEAVDDPPIIINSSGAVKWHKADSPSPPIKSLSIPNGVTAEELYKNYKLPSAELLNHNRSMAATESRAQILENSHKLEETLRSFRVEAKVVEVSVGPTVTRYEMAPGQGVKVSQIANLSNDLALSLAAQGIRIEAPIPGKSAVGIEIPTTEMQPVYLREIIEDEKFQNATSKLAVAIGKDIAGNTVVSDIAKMPHLLIDRKSVV
jgi:DNA segregation ATPase FtsK/SpoIIIE-like protein